MISKNAFLEELTSKTRFRSMRVDNKKFEGTTPPSVFIGRANYPKVFAGPMLSPQQDSAMHDAPEQWLGKFERDQIIKFRLNLLRGTKTVHVTDVAGRFAQQMQDIALAKKTLHAHTEFQKVPQGTTFSGHHQPFGPSGPITHLETDNTTWNKHMEKAHYDHDLLAKDALVALQQKGVPFTVMQKALSTGAFGTWKRRKLVPTRWSITATDDTLGKHRLQNVRHNEVIDEYRIYESKGLYNNFRILLTPTTWQYEAKEAFINILGRTVIFGDHERFKARTTYSKMGGCYYAQRFAIADHLMQRQEQAGAFVFREVHEDYVPTGVWVCRELTKQALENEPKTFPTLQEAFQYLDKHTRLGLPAFKQQMPLLCDINKQKRIQDYY